MLLAPLRALAEKQSKNPGEFDTLSCDKNGDLEADSPNGPKKLKNPGTLVIASAPVEDPAGWKSVSRPFPKPLSKSTGKGGV